MLFPGEEMNCLFLVEDMHCFFPSRRDALLFSQLLKHWKARLVSTFSREETVSFLNVLL